MSKNKKSKSIKEFKEGQSYNIFHDEMLIKEKVKFIEEKDGNFYFNELTRIIYLKKDGIDMCEFEEI